MNESTKPRPGSIAWVDVTVPNADRLRDFYSAVVGWSASNFEMGGYNDYCMNEPEAGKTVAGICHARGANADLPSQWLVYIAVADLDRSMKRTVELGGTIITGPKPMGDLGRYCVIEDPAGAVAALFQPAEQRQAGA
jgi:predicted enzyme related to lactoylglutathione lyase